MSIGLLILCSPINYLQSRAGYLAAAVAQHVGKILYVQLEPDQVELWPLHYQAMPTNPELIRKCGAFVSNFYTKCYNISKTLDVRFLLSTLKHAELEKMVLSKSLDIVLTDMPQSPATMEKYMNYRFKNVNSGVQFVNMKTANNRDSIPLPSNGHASPKITSPWLTYDNVVLGGTFDRLHSGHKILLSEAILRCDKQLTIGVTDGPMIKGKILWELIEPFDVRTSALREFLKDVGGHLDYKTEPIIDPFGPSIVDPKLQCIVVSEDTLKGGLKVNEERAKKGLCTLDVHSIELMADIEHDSHEDNKISSSSFRIRSLGVRRINSLIEKPHLAKSPYVIGLTGGIASGKSSIAKRLQSLGGVIIDCDKLGHQSYSIGMPAYHQIIQNFGSDVVSADGTINRRVLGQKVFTKEGRLDELNKIVWPEIRRLAKAQIDQFSENGVKIVIIDAAVLLEAGWDDLVHEIWVSIIPEKEALKRIQERDGISKTQAQERIARQMGNEEKVTHANVVFSTFWEPEFTQKQVETAWTGLNYLIQHNKAHKL